MKLIMENWRKVLKEMAMKKPLAAAGDGMALAHYNSAAGGKRHFVLFDPERAMRRLRRWLKTAEEYDQRVGKSDILTAINNEAVAVMEINEEDDGTWSGRRVASESGWGPTMYELMMMIAPKGFTSDRRAMSSSHTWPIWEKYMARDDVQKTPLKSAGDFQGKHEWQNLAFKIPNDGSFQALASNYDRFLSDAIASHPEYSRPGYITKDTMGLFSVVGDMFGEKYREAGYFGGGEDY